MDVQKKELNPSLSIHVDLKTDNTIENSMALEFIK